MSQPIMPTRQQGNRLSLYRTDHEFRSYMELHSYEQLPELAAVIAANPAKSVYMLGNGSNVLFSKKVIKSIVVKNRLPRFINELKPELLEVSGSCMIMEVLRHCFRSGLDSFYYLASVPATIGGALAMNAGRGRGHHMTVYDFVQDITYFDFRLSQEITATPAELGLDYRRTPFSGPSPGVILRATFCFQQWEFGGLNPIEERQSFSRETQDHSAPNCGSVFREFDMKLLQRVRRKHWKMGKARFSGKTLNWLLNESQSPRSALGLIHRVEWIHRLLGKPISREIVVIK